MFRNVFICMHKVNIYRYWNVTIGFEVGKLRNCTYLYIFIRSNVQICSTTLLSCVIGIMRSSVFSCRANNCIPAWNKLYHNFPTNFLFVYSPRMLGLQTPFFPFFLSSQNSKNLADNKSTHTFNEKVIAKFFIIV